MDGDSGSEAPMTNSAATTAPLPRYALGEGTTAFEAAVEQARSEDWATRLFDRDTTLWSTDPRVQEAIAQRLGWLDAPEEFANRTASLEGFGDWIAESGFATVVLAGMGGSSLAPDVFRRTFGSTEGYPELRILNSTDPAFVAATLDDLDPLSTLVHRRVQVRHDDRAERVPGGCVGPCRGGRSP